MAKSFNKKHAKPAPVTGDNTEEQMAKNGVLNSKEMQKRNKEHDKRMTQIMQEVLDVWGKHKLRIAEGLDLCVMLQKYMNIQVVQQLNKVPVKQDDSKQPKKN